MNIFTIYPAIDLRGGKCVRLKQGDYDQMTVYGDDPAAVAKRFVEQGATYLHVVDLDGAKEGSPQNRPVIEQIVKEAGVPVQVGGGIRDQRTIEALLSIGVSRCILGTVAVEKPDFTRAVLREFGVRIAIGVDAKEGMVATRGWLETSEISALELGKQLKDWGAGTVIFTDIARDGMLGGPNVAAIVEMARETGLEVIASGGVRGINDLLELSTYASDGVGGAIVGKAIYAAGMDLADAISKVAKHRDSQSSVYSTDSAASPARGKEDGRC